MAVRYLLELGSKSDFELIGKGNTVHRLLPSISDILHGN